MRIRLLSAANISINQICRFLFHNDFYFAIAIKCFSTMLRFL